MRLKSTLLLLAVAALASCSTVQAQTRAFANPSNTDGRVDTFANAGTSYLDYPINALGVPITVQFIATKVSGTLSATAYLETSIDPNAAATSYTAIDSLVFVDQTTNKLTKVFDSNGYTKYRWRVVRTGTQAFIAKAYLAK